METYNCVSFHIFICMHTYICIYWIYKADNNLEATSYRLAFIVLKGSKKSKKGEKYSLILPDSELCELLASHEMPTNETEEWMAWG